MSGNYRRMSGTEQLLDELTTNGALTRPERRLETHSRSTGLTRDSVVQRTLTTVPGIEPVSRERIMEVIVDTMVGLQQMILESTTEKQDAHSPIRSDKMGKGKSGGWKGKQNGAKGGGRFGSKGKGKGGKGNFGFSKGGGKGKGGKKGGACWNCGKTGHKSAECCTGRRELAKWKNQRFLWRQQRADVGSVEIGRVWALCAVDTRNSFGDLQRDDEEKSLPYLEDSDDSGDDHDVPVISEDWKTVGRKKKMGRFCHICNMLQRDCLEMCDEMR